jgi:hypothetical protein
MPFQETISKIQLVGLDADLQVAVTAWMGMAQIRIKQNSQAQYLKQIVTEMNAYYEATPVKVNNTVFVVYLLLGILMLVMAAVLAFALRF